MLVRTVCMLLLLAALALPCRAYASHYRVRSGDTLALVAQRYHTSVNRLAAVNGISNPNLLQRGRVLWVPIRSGRLRGRSHYLVRWGDTLSGIAARYGVSLGTIRALNPSLGTFPLAGQWLTVYGSMARGYGSNGFRAAAGGVTHYTVRAGDTLSAIASSHGVSVSTLMATNHVRNPHVIILGSTLFIPVSAGTVSTRSYDPWPARSIITQYAYRFGLSPALPLAVGWQESGFNQAALSRTGAIGVMQVEPYTAVHISSLLGLRLNLHNLDDNIHAGVFWLSALVRYYRGNERLAVAAYYQGSRALARHGMYGDTVQYVASVGALRSRFSG